MTQDFIPPRPVQPAPPAPAPEVHEVGWQPVTQPNGQVEEHGIPYVRCSSFEQTGAICADCDREAHEMVVRFRLESFRPQ